MTVYYVNSSTGSDNNVGTSEGSAFASLSAVEGIKLQPGDSVLLAAGSVFNEQFDLKYSGTTVAPITVGMYGLGEAPVIQSSGDGIHGSKASNIIVENIKIAFTGGNAIYAGNVSNWVVRNVEVSDTGLAGRAGSISFQSSQNIAIVNTRVEGTNGDGIWMEKVSGITLLNNTVLNSHGAAADAIQLNDSSGILIAGNHLQQTETNSAKGVLVLVRADNAVVVDNTLIGGGFGLSAQAGNNIAIHGNDISGFGGYSWSYGIGLGDQGDARNYDISGNHIHDGAWGVSISAAGYPDYLRENINVHANVFDGLSGAAIKVDRSASGSFHDNVVEAGVTLTKVSTAVAVEDTFAFGDNRTVPGPQDGGNTPDHAGNGPDAVPTPQTPQPVPDNGPAPVATHPVPKIVAVHDTLTIATDTGAAYHGNLLDNDVSANGNVFLRRFGEAAVDKNGLTIMGKYGVIHIELDGGYTYSVDTHKLAGLSGRVSESFQYKISDGASHIDTDTLAISINVDAFHGSHLLG